MNATDYLRWRGEIPFSMSPFNDVDNLILCEFPYLNWDGIVTEKPITLEHAIEKYVPVAFDSTLKDMRQEMVMLACRSERFKDVQAFSYVKDFNDEEEKQFCAMCFKLPDKTYFVSFCGTDSTITGWKENFNMAYLMPVPAQKEAADYLKTVVNRYSGMFRVGGHSKGGNLSFYASVMLNRPDRLLQVYNNDGPGFDKKFVQSTAYQEMKPKLKTFIPESSVIGRLLNDDSNVHVVKSATYDITWQHSVLMWEVDVTRLIEVRDTTLRSKYIDDVMDQWNDGLSTEEKLIFINTIYDTLVEMDIKTSDELLRHPARITAKVLGKMQDLDEPTRKIMSDVMSVLVKSNVTSFSKNYISKLLGGKKNENPGI